MQLHRILVIITEHKYIRYLGQYLAYSMGSLTVGMCDNFSFHAICRYILIAKYNYVLKDMN